MALGTSGRSWGGRTSSSSAKLTRTSSAAPMNEDQYVPVTSNQQPGGQRADRLSERPDRGGEPAHLPRPICGDEVHQQRDVEAPFARPTIAIAASV